MDTTNIFTIKIYLKTLYPSYYFSSEFTYAIQKYCHFFFNLKVNNPFEIGFLVISLYKEVYTF